VVPLPARLVARWVRILQDADLLEAAANPGYRCRRESELFRLIGAAASPGLDAYAILADVVALAPSGRTTTPG
jgi:hypothetical protein